MAANMPKNTGPFPPGRKPKRPSVPSGSQAAAKKASAAKDAIRKTAASSGPASKKAVPMKPARPTYTKPGFRSPRSTGGVNKGPKSRNRY